MGTHPTLVDQIGNSFQPRTRSTDGSVAGDPASMQEVVVVATMVDRSSSIGAAGVQQLMPANTIRRGWAFYCQGYDVWINDCGGTAQVGGASWKIAAGQLYESHSTGCSGLAISAYFTGITSYHAREWQ